MTVNHPGKTDAEKRILDQIGCGDSLPRANAKTLDRMVERGLIRRVHDKVLSSDRFGAIAIPQYEMTIHTHMDWCAYWAENATEGDDA